MPEFYVRTESEYRESLLPPIDPELVCIVCESGYHGEDWEIKHLLTCGCPCHVVRQPKDIRYESDTVTV